MLEIESVPDVSGNQMQVGDTVVAVSDQTTGRVVEVMDDDGVTFVRVRPAHQSTGRGVWYASDQVFWVARPNAGKSSSDGASRQHPAKKK